MQTVRLGRVLLAAAAASLLPLAGNVIASLLTDWTGRASWLVVPVVGVLIAMIVAVVDAYGSARPPGKGETPFVGAIAIAVLVIGIGGLGIAEGTRSLVIASEDLPREYVKIRSDRFSSLDRCAEVSGWPAATRTLRAKLAALGLERCELVQYRRRDHTTGSSNQPTSQAFVMRNDEAAAQLVPLLRRLYLSTIDPDGTDARPHSLPAPKLGDQSPRGVTIEFRHPRTGRTLVNYWVYWWRRGKVAAWVATSDGVGDFDRVSTLELARAVDSRVAD